LKEAGEVIRPDADANKRSNLLYRDRLSGKGAPDEETSFIGDGESPGYHAKKGWYPDLHNYLLGGQSVHVSRHQTREQTCDRERFF
jgi:hypothetical protein